MATVNYLNVLNTLKSTTQFHQKPQNLDFVSLRKILNQKDFIQMPLNLKFKFVAPKLIKILNVLIIRV